MTFQGKIHNGMVVFEGDPNLPEGTPVMVMVQSDSRPNSTPVRELSDEELQRRNSMLDAIADLPIEGSSEPFSGRDHDKVLYGKP